MNAFLNDNASAIAWDNPARAHAFSSWLAGIARPHGAHDLDINSVRLASADASFRRYFRVDAAIGANSYIIMDAPPDKEDCTPFVKVAALMAASGL